MQTVGRLVRTGGRSRVRPVWGQFAVSGPASCEFSWSDKAEKMLGAFDAGADTEAANGGEPACRKAVICNRITDSLLPPADRLGDLHSANNLADISDIGCRFMFHARKHSPVNLNCLGSDRA